MLSIVLLAPMLLQRIRMPHIIGMLLAGVIFGPHGLGVLARDDSFELFGKVGLYYIMFLASLEMDMVGVKRRRWAVAVTGILAFAVPLLIGIFTNHVLLELNIWASLLLAGMYASHTLLTYPIVARYGLSRHRAVTMAVGGTIVAVTLTLILLAFVGGICTGEGGTEMVLLLVAKLFVVSLVILLGFPRICRWFLRRYNDGVLQYVFVLLLVFLAAVMMEMIGVEGLLGAFLAGIALNRLIPHQSPIMSRIEFVGNAIFIPFFLVNVGMLINMGAMLKGSGVLMIASVMTFTAVISKWIACELVGKIYKLCHSERGLIFGLSNARAAATIAIVLIGYNTIMTDGSRLINDDVFNATFLFIFASCTLSSMVTEICARNMALAGASLEREDDMQTDSPLNHMLVAMAYQNTVEPLMTLALLMRGVEQAQLESRAFDEASRKRASGITAVSVFYEEYEDMRLRAKDILESAERLAASANVHIDSKLRVSTNLANGIIHTMMENNFSELLVAQHIERKPGGSFYGPVLTDLLTGLNRLIMMVRPKRPWNTIRTIHVAVPAKAEYEAGFEHWVKRISRLGVGLGCKVVFHCNNESQFSIQQYVLKNHTELRAEYEHTDGGNELKHLRQVVSDEDMLVVICARRGSISYRASFDHIPVQIRRDYMETTTMLVFPDGYETTGMNVSFSQPTAVTVRYEG